MRGVIIAVMLLSEAGATAQDARVPDIESVIDMPADEAFAQATLESGGADIVADVANASAVDDAETLASRKAARKRAADATAASALADAESNGTATDVDVVADSWDEAKRAADEAAFTIDLFMWEKLGSDDKGVEWSIRPHAMKAYQSQPFSARMVWAKSDATKVPSEDAEQVIALWKIDCNRGWYEPVQVTYFPRDKGNPVTTQNRHGYYIMPDTMVSEAMLSVCVRG